MQGPSNLDGARQFVKSLRMQTKAQVFSIWCATCLGRIHFASIKEQRKGWMIYDIVCSKFGKAAAEQVA